MDGAGGERVLEHLQHCGVSFTGLADENGTVVAEVEVEFDLAEVLVVCEAAGLDFGAGLMGRGGGGGVYGGTECGELGGGEVVGEGDVGDGAGDSGSDPGSGGLVFKIGGFGGDGIAAEGFESLGGWIDLVDHARH